MKFEQAFYTWGENQLSRYKKGLGVCAASNLQSEFLDSCLALGSSFKSEHTDRTAEFVLYSQEFRAFVGVGISPAGESSDGRLNKLCHFFVPVKEEQADKPEDYLLVYPYKRQVEERADLSQIILKQEEYDYKRLLVKYNFGEKKLSEFLYKIFPCILGEQNNLVFIIDREKFPVEEDARIAREITWLASELVPIVWGNRDTYRKRISYGVYTVDNMQAVRFIFTDTESEGRISFYLNRDEEEEIPDVYRHMAERALEGRGELQGFYEEFYKCRYAREIKVPDMSLLYHRWRLNQGEYVSEMDLGNEKNVIIMQSGRSSWHKNLFWDYLKQEKALDNSMLVQAYKRLIFPAIKTLDKESEEQKQKLKEELLFVLEKIRTVSWKNYWIILSEAPEDIKQELLADMYKTGRFGIQEELEALCNPGEIREFICHYMPLRENDGFCHSLIQKAEYLYEKENREGRQQISDSMRQVEENAWDSYLETRVDKYCTWEAFENHLEAEGEQIELTSIKFYLEKIVVYAKETNDPEIRKKIGRYFEALYQRGDKEKLDEVKKKFSAIEVRWKIEKINDWIKGENLAQLAENSLPEIQYRECKETWAQWVYEKIKEEKEIGEGLYKRLLIKLPEMGENGLERESQEKYAEALWENAGGSLYKKILFEYYQKKSGYTVRKSIWKERAILSFNEFERLRNLLEQRRGEGEIKAFRREIDDLNEPEVSQLCYQIWEDVCCGKQIRETSINALRGNPEEENGVLRSFQESLQKVLSRERDIFPNSVYNYLRLQIWKEQLCSYIERNDLWDSMRMIYASNENFIEAVKGEMPELAEDSEVKGLWSSVKRFLSLLDWKEEIAETNVAQAARIVGSCKADQLLADINQVKCLEEECKQIMDEIKSTKKQMEKAREQVDTEIKELYQRIASLEADKNELTEKIQEKEKIYREADACLKNQNIDRKTENVKAKVQAQDKSLHTYPVENTKYEERPLESSIWKGKEKVQDDDFCDARKKDYTKIGR